MKRLITVLLMIITFLPILSTTIIAIQTQEYQIESIQMNNTHIISYYNQNDYDRIQSILAGIDLPFDKKLPRMVPGEVIVKFKENTTLTLSSQNDIIQTGIESIDVLNKQFKVTSANKIFEYEQESNLNNIYVISLDETINLLEVVEQYNNDPNVEIAEADYYLDFYSLTGLEDSDQPLIDFDSQFTGYIPNDPYFNMQYALHNIGQTGGTSDADVDAPEAWEIQQGRPDIIIAVPDTGVDINHPDLADNIWINDDEIPDNGIDDDKNGFIDDIYGWNFYDKSNDVIDEFGHGTHCSGIIAAVIDNELGVAGIAGKCKIMPLKLYTLKNTIESIKYAIDNDANIISMSFGLNPFVKTNETGLLGLTLTYADLKGMVLIAAAGNSPDFLSSVGSLPASHDKVIAVAATDHNDMKASFSTYGSFIDVAAPGCDILSLRAAGTDMYQGSLGYEEGAFFVPPFDENAILYRSWGTSMSCPLVAGVAALVLSQKPGLSNSEVRTILRSSTDPVISDEFIGIGRINANKALNKAEHVTAELSNKLDYAIIEGNYKIKGFATGSAFQEYTLEYAQGTYPSEDSWTVIGSGQNRVLGGTLLTWSTTQANDGPYTLRLRVKANNKFFEDRKFIIIDNVESTYNVDDDYNENTYGWGINNFKNIPQAINFCGNKDTIFVHRGVYPDSFKIQHRSVTIIGEDKDQTFLEGGIITHYGTIKLMSFTKRYSGSIGTFFSDNNVFSDLKIVDFPTATSIALIFSSKNTITNNYFSNPIKNSPEIAGMFFVNDNTISGNTIIGNSLLLAGSSKRNKIQNNNLNSITGTILFNSNEVSNNNIIKGDKGTGLYIEGGKFNNIHDNIISDIETYQSVSCGIALLPCSNVLVIGVNIGNYIGDLSFNIISNNEISNCDIGIYGATYVKTDENGQVIPDEYVTVKSNIISKNNIKDTDIAIYLCGSQKNIISENTIMQNNYGLVIVPWTDGTNNVNGNSNEIYYNDFIDNTVHAYDKCQNIYYRPILQEGNYWDDYTSKYTGWQIIHRALRADVYSIAYDIDGGTNQDMFPLVNAHSNEQNTPQSTPQTQPSSEPYTESSTESTSEPSSEPTSKNTVENTMVSTTLLGKTTRNSV
jgi:parallel beta-helix repeat protein